VPAADRLTLFLCGDVMTGRGIDQALPRSCPPHLYEPVVTSALEYLRLAERANGPIPRPLDYEYVWGEALQLLERTRPNARIINLETSVTTSEAAAHKRIHYRMHPENVAVLTAAGIDCCVLANNHVLDWGETGLVETLQVLARAGIAVAGAGADAEAARTPAVLDAGSGRRILVFGFGTGDSGIPREWAAGDRHPGVHRLPDLSESVADGIGRRVDASKAPGDVAVASIHWGGNWGFDIPAAHRRFARALIDRAGIDVVHGHSSHHPRAIELYRDRPILYGCGDFLNDYEGIRGYEEFRGDLVLMYFLTLDPRSGRLLRLHMTPLRIRNFRLGAPAPADRDFLRYTLDRECRRFGRRIVEQEGDLVLA
jgi:poly-gamma-glutamate capsule biosynthesis protein CapA/YwtB (metallophosphatase superfamily)